MRNIEHLPTAVYRLWDAEGRLLYVGMSNNPEGRWSYHEGWSWWSRVARKEVEWHPDRATARREEATAIRTEAPLLNAVHMQPGPQETPLTNARSRLGKIIQRVCEKHEPHWLTSFSRRRVVILRPEVYEEAIRNEAIVAALRDADPDLYEQLTAEITPAA